MNVVPIIHYRERQAQMAQEVHFALVRAELNNQALRDNPLWKRMRKEALKLFTDAFDACGGGGTSLEKVRGRNGVSAPPAPDHEREKAR